MRIDGRMLAEAVLEQARSVLTTHTLTLEAIVIAPTPATRSYLALKERAVTSVGGTLVVTDLAPDVTEEEGIASMVASSADALIVQLPVPPALRTDALLNAVPRAKDADVLSREARDAFMRGEEGALLPPVVGAVAEILLHAAVPIPGARVVVVGEGRLVGEPVAAWLTQQGGVVTSMNENTFSEDQLRDADIIVSGAGVPNLIHSHMLKHGVVLIDAGTSTAAGKITGDSHPDCAERASVYSPVPGGVGPIAVAFLVRNAAILVRARTQ